MGTWRITTLHPSLWCRAGSFSGAPAVTLQDVAALKHVPFYILHGTHDHIPVQGPRKVAKELKRLGYDHIFVEYNGDHFPSPALKNDMAAWLAKAQPRTTTSPRPALMEFLACQCKKKKNSERVFRLITRGVITFKAATPGSDSQAHADDGHQWGCQGK